MEYFGYLGRDPDADGYQYWLNKLNQFNGNFEQAEMVKAFFVSGVPRTLFPLDRPERRWCGGAVSTPAVAVGAVIGIGNGGSNFQVRPWNCFAPAERDVYRYCSNPDNWRSSGAQHFLDGWDAVLCFAPLERGESFGGHASYKHLAPLGPKRRTTPVALPS
jgi:hypothetical protein